MAAPGPEPRVARHEHTSSWRGFRRARQALWCALLLAASSGALLYDLRARFALARIGWLVFVLLLLAYPLKYLFGFRCPRCNGVYLASGGVSDFLGPGRLLWSNRCGTCSLPAGDAPLAAEVPDSGPLS